MGNKKPKKSEMNFKFWFILALSFIASLLIGWRVLLPVFLPETDGEGLVKVRVGEAQVLVEIADETDEIAQGLSGRASLPANQGMLFVLPSRSQPAYWMKEMNFDLDMIWIDNGRVVEIGENIPAPVGGEEPVTYQPQVAVTDVLEVNAGWARSNGVSVGDMVVLE